MNSAWHRLRVALSERKAKALPFQGLHRLLASKAMGADVSAIIGKT
ncbi:hypothetical protein ACFSKY_14705 [Azotobacter chroococcum]